MDYLQRDSFFSGVNYGKFDADWLIDNVTPVQEGSAVYLGINARAVFSFEDFLLSRYHMFATVYLHYTPVIFERMLARYFEEAGSEFTLPSDVERYALLDDMDLWVALRKSDNRWAKRIIARKPYVLLAERSEHAHLARAGIDYDRVENELKGLGIDCVRTRSKTTLSKYFNQGEGKNSIFVVTKTERPVPLESYTALYARYETPALLDRLYVDPARRKDASRALENAIEEQERATQPTVPFAEA